MTNQNKTTKYIMYCRKSTDSEDKQIQSIDDQIRELNKLAKERGAKIVKVLTESQSAKKPGRPIFNDMINMLHNNEADGIICWRINRLARNPKDGGDIQWMLQQNNIKSILTPGREYLPTDNVLMMSVELGMANQFILDLRRDVQRGLDSKLAKGWMPNSAPIGYLNDKTGDKGTKKIFVDNERFPMIRKMWDLILTGNYTTPQILEKANNEWGLTTRARKNTPPTKLSSSTGYRIFTNHFYYGEFEYSGKMHQGKHTPMITKDEFDKVQFLLGRKGSPRTKVKKLPFTGIIMCSECGCSITCEEKFKNIKKTGEIKKYVYHRCTKRNKKLNCSQKPITNQDLTEQIEEFLTNITIPQDYLDWTIDILNSTRKREVSNRNIILKNLQKNYQDCADKISSLIQSFTSPSNKDRSLISDEELKEQKNTLIKEKANINEKIQNLDQDFNEWIELTEKTFKFCTYAKYWFENGNIEDKNSILRTLGSNFILKDKKLSINLAKPFSIIKKELIFKAPLNMRLESMNIPINAEVNNTFEAILPVLSRRGS